MNLWTLLVLPIAAILAFGVASIALYVRDVRQRQRRELVRKVRAAVRTARRAARGR